MTPIIYALLIALVGGGIFLAVPAKLLAAFISKALPAVLIVAGGIMTFAGAGVLGVPLIAFGIGLWRRARATETIRNRANRGHHSTARSAALEMRLDHDTGEMEGLVLSGNYEGQWLSEMSVDHLLDLHLEVRVDEQSIALLEAFLDRQFPDWRDRSGSGAGTGEAGLSGAGGMSRKEAYQILGLEPGASEKDIRDAWRKLMKGMHPDHGGSEFLARKINAAKDILLK